MIDNPTINVITCLSSLCNILGVTVAGLMRAGGVEPVSGAVRHGPFILGEWLQAYFDSEDKSVQDVLKLILKAAEEPLWPVQGYSVDERNGHTFLGMVQVRGRNQPDADDEAYARLWDARLRSASCCWASGITRVADEDAGHCGSAGRIGIDK